MPRLFLALPTGWTYSEESEFTPYGWQTNVTVTHDCGEKVTRAIHSVKDDQGVANELYLAIKNHKHAPINED